MRFGAKITGIAGFFTLILFQIPVAFSSVFHNQLEALALAFPDATRTESEVFILDDAQAEIIERAGRSQLATRLVTIYRGYKGDTLLGYAHIDVHTVRTKPEAFMIVLDLEASISQVRVLAFHEPLEFMPAGRWYDSFLYKRPADDIRIGFDVDSVTGATLTTRATVDSIRRMFAYYEVLLRPEQKKSMGGE